MTDEERQILNDEWLECQRTMWGEFVSSTDYHKALDRSKEIEAKLRGVDDAAIHSRRIADEAGGHDSIIR